MRKQVKNAAKLDEQEPVSKSSSSWQRHVSRVTASQLEIIARAEAAAEPYIIARQKRMEYEKSPARVKEREREREIAREKARVAVEEAFAAFEEAKRSRTRSGPQASVPGTE